MEHIKQFLNLWNMAHEQCYTAGYLVMLQIYGTTWTEYLDIKDGVGIFVKKTF